jgi:anti-anti-sigma factor
VEDALRLDLERFLDRGRPVRVDLRGVTFMDSAGLRSLMRLHLAHGAALQIDGVSEPVGRLFAVAGIGHVLMGSAGGATHG